MANLYRKTRRARDSKTGELRAAKSKKWYARYRETDGRERRIALSSDKKISQLMLADILHRIEREKAGIIDETLEIMQKPLNEHMEDFERHLRAKNDTPRHIRETLSMIRKVAGTQGWTDLRDLKATELEIFLDDLMNHLGRSVERGNHYIRSLKSFGNWLVDNDRMVKNPFRKLKTLNASGDRRHLRRPLSTAEFDLLMDAAASGPPVQGISGTDRAMLYQLAAWTGFRRKELGSLTRRHIRLDAPVPYITIPAAYSKRRRNDVQYLHSGLVESLQNWLTQHDSGPDELLFPIEDSAGGVDRRTSKMMEFDLNAARTFWLAESENAKEEQKRMASDFLRYCDSEGKYADFHSLRHTFITNLSLSGVDPKTAQTLARHSDIKLTMNVYTHLNAQTQIDAINSLPAPNKND